MCICSCLNNRIQLRWERGTEIHEMTNTTQLGIDGASVGVLQ